MTKQERVIEMVKNEIEVRVWKHNQRFGDRSRKQVERLEVEDLGAGDIKVITFTVNLEGGNVYTEQHGQLFVGPKGGLKGRVESGLNSKAKINGLGQAWKIGMWI